MDLRSEIKKNLLGFIEKMCGDNPEDFEKAIKLYGDEGEKEFYVDVERAVDALMHLSQYEFTDVYENLRDVKPAKRGVLLCEGVDRAGGTYDFEFLQSSKETDFAEETFVYEWAKSTLQNPYYTDLFSHMIRYGEGVVDEHGCLTGLGVEVRVLTYLLITDTFEFIPVRLREIYLQLSDENEFSLYKNFILNENICPYEELEELLTEIIDMGSILKIVE